MIKCKIIGVYKYESPCGKIYVGSSKNIYKRFVKYRNLNCQTQRKLLESIKEFGFIEDKFDIIESFEIYNLQELRNQERYWQEYYNTLYPNGLNLYLTKGYQKPEIKSKESENIIKLNIINYPNKFKESRKRGHETLKSDPEKFKNAYIKMSQSRKSDVFVDNIPYDNGSDAARKLGLSVKVVNRRLQSKEYPNYIRILKS